MMSIFRQLRWKLTLSYTGVTVSAFLVVVLIVGGIVFSQIFIPVNILSPTGLLEIISTNSTPLWRHVLTQSPVDTDLVDLLLNDPNGTITSFDFFRIGAVQFSVRTVASLRALVIGPDGSLLGTTHHGFPSILRLGKFSTRIRFQAWRPPYVPRWRVKQMQNVSTPYLSRTNDSCWQFRSSIAPVERWSGSLCQFSKLFPPRVIFPGTSWILPAEACCCFSWAQGHGSDLRRHYC